MSKELLGSLLIKAGLITEGQLEESLQDQEKESVDVWKLQKRRLGHILIDLGYLKSESLGPLLEEQLSFPYVDLKKSLIEPAIINLLDAYICRRYQVVPFSKEGDVLTLAMINPNDLIAIEDIKFITGCQVKVVISPQKVLLESLDQYYGPTDKMKEIAKTVAPEREEVALIEKEELGLEELQKMAAEAPVVKMVNHMITEAVGKKASDIHIESFKNGIRLRYRVDGILHEFTPPPRRVQSAIVSRIKIMAGLNIAERRLPQDGRISAKVGGRKIDLRVSVVNTVYGEKIMLRILDKSALSLDLESLGFEPDDLAMFKKGITRPYGILLVTGPTGCGKTTTLYAALRKIYNPEMNIITVEEPIEYESYGISQVQTNNEIGLNFASALRHFLRQDPDIIMVGEIRDYETAEIAIRAALTGHLVLSTVHTNDAPSTVIRLIDLGVSPFLIVASLHMVISQRLVRLICPKCKVSYTPSQEFLEKTKFFHHMRKNIQLYKGEGCEQCGYLGYKGRIAVFEAMPLNKKINELIMERVAPHIIRREMKEMGIRGLGENAFRKALAGLTTVEEVLRVSLEEEEIKEVIDE